MAGSSPLGSVGGNLAFLLFSFFLLVLEILLTLCLHPSL